MADDTGFLSQFIDFDGVGQTEGGAWVLQGTFRPVALVATLLSAAILAVFNGLIRVIRATFGIVLGPLDGLRTFVTTLIRTAIGPGGLFVTAVSETQAQLLASGIIGFAVAATITAVTLYIVNLGVEAVG